MFLSSSFCWLKYWSALCLALTLLTFSRCTCYLGGFFKSHGIKYYKYSEESQIFISFISLLCKKIHQIIIYRVLYSSWSLARFAVSPFSSGISSFVHNQSWKLILYWKDLVYNQDRKVIIKMFFLQNKFPNTQLEMFMLGSKTGKNDYVVHSYKSRLLCYLSTSFPTIIILCPLNTHTHTHTLLWR